MSKYQNYNRIPVLTYHSIDNSNSVISVSVVNFKKQVSFLKQKGYKTYSLLEIVNHIKRGTFFPTKGIVITFDDGYKNNYTEAFPILKKYGYTATIFLTTGRCGKSNSWPNQDPSIPQLSMLSWEEIREMSRYGIDFGAHTTNHPDLTQIAIDRTKLELIESKEAIEAQIDQPVELFSYPFGRFNKEIQDVTKTAFKGAIATTPGKINTKSDIYALERINLTGQIFKLLPFNILFFGSLNFYLVLKTMLNRLSGSGIKKKS